MDYSPARGLYNLTLDKKSSRKGRRGSKERSFCILCPLLPSGVVCHATTDVLSSAGWLLYKTKGVNTLPKVTLRSDESGEQLLRRFSREVVKSRVLTDVRRKRWFVSKSELTRIAKKKAARRTRKSQKEQQQGV